VPHSLWPLRLLSLATAIVLWLVFSYSGRQSASSERTLTNVPVTYNTPQGYILMNPTSSLSIRVSGGEQAVLNLTPFQVSTVVSLAPRAGIQEIVLDERHIERPKGIDVVSITPDRLSLDVDREIEKRLRVVPDPRGEPAAGAVEGQHTADPEYVTVKGPQSSLESRDTIFAPVSIGGRAHSFEQSVTLDTADPLVQVLGSSTVRVSVILEPPSLQSGLPRSRPRTNAQSPTSGAA
jgi:YbbR domain-containing protein